MHDDENAFPCEFDVVPTGQDEQGRIDSDAPPPYLPGGHFKHSNESAFDLPYPGAQRSHEDDPIPEFQLPAGQIVHPAEVTPGESGTPK